MGGTSSKSTFSELVHALLTKDIDTNDHEFWDELWKTVLTVEEIFEVISADDMRQMINLHPENLRTIFTQAVAQLYQVVETPYPIYFNQALNCTRILSRMLPILLEITSQITHVRYGFVKELLWSKRVVKNLPQEATTNTTTIEGAEDGEETKEVHGNGEGDGEVQESEPLAVILVNTMYHLLFLPDFTVEDPSVDFNENDINTTAFKSALMWAPGVGSVEKTVTASTQFDLNRVEILRLMIATFSDSLYQQADHYDSCASMWLEVATSVDAPYAEIVFYSLMNTVLGTRFLFFALCLTFSNALLC